MNIKKIILLYLKKFTWYAPIRSKFFNIFYCIKNIPRNIREIPNINAKSHHRKIYEKYSETHVSWGEENPDKTFYVIRHATAQGVFSFCTTAIDHYMYAKAQGYIPVVGQVGCTNDFLFRKITSNMKNAWDIFFNPADGFTLEMINKSKNIIVANAFDVPAAPNYSHFNWLKYDYNTDSKYWNDLFKNFISFNVEAYNQINLKAEKILNILYNKKVLGVSIRRGIAWGHSNNASSGNMHPEETTLDKNIFDITAFMQDYKYEYVFCACDDTEAIIKLEEHFGNKLLCIDRQRVNYYEYGKPSDLEKLKFPEEITRAYEYITEIYILSKCSGLHGNRNGGTLMASIWNNGEYENIFIYENELKQTKKTSYLKEVNGYVV